MKQITREILDIVLRDPAAWTPIKDGKFITGHKPKMEYIRHSYLNAREMRFYDDVYFPHLARLMEIVKRWDLFKGATWTTRELGYDKCIELWVPTEWNFQNIIGDHMQWYMEPLWDHDEKWGLEEITETDILSLGIKPEKLEAVQAMLF